MSTRPKTEPRLVTIADAARMLGVSTDTVYRLASGGDLRLIDMSKPDAARPAWRIDLADIHALIARRTA
jgi:excisionase family DNA binding protein